MKTIGVAAIISIPILIFLFWRLAMMDDGTSTGRFAMWLYDQRIRYRDWRFACRNRCRR